MRRGTTLISIMNPHGMQDNIILQPLTEASGNDRHRSSSTSFACIAAHRIGPGSVAAGNLAAGGFPLWTAMEEPGILIMAIWYQHDDT